MKQIILMLLMATLIISCHKNCESNPKITSQKGCGDFFVYDALQVQNHDNTFISFQIFRDSISLTNSYQLFDLATNPFLESKIEAFNMAYVPYCNDALDPNFKIMNTWVLQYGKAEVRIVRDKNDCEFGYVVDVRILNATYQDSLGDTIVINEKLFNNVIVGWYAG